MGKNLVLIGGGHAHMVSLANLHVFVEKGHKVTVIGPSPYHYYSGMGPGMLGTTYRPSDIRFATRQVVEKQGGRFIQDKVTYVDPHEKKAYLEAGESVPYDVLSFNAGSYVPNNLVKQDKGDIFSVKPIETLIQAQNRVVELASKSKITIGIVGGGPSSAEIAGNILQLVKRKGLYSPRIVIFCSRNFMASFSARTRFLVMKLLHDRGVEIVENSPVREVETGKIIIDGDQSMDVDLIILAVGVKPSSIFEKSGLPTGPDGGLLVNRFLQCTEFPELFGGGDCIYFADQPLDKVGVYAVRENPILYQNLLAALAGGTLQAFDPGGAYLLIFNLGEGIGVLKKYWLNFGGSFAFTVKDYIDRKFMARFQAIED